MKTRVAIVGAGPAGSAAAVTLARAGITCCLIDKSEFPRDKLCGGLVSGRARRLIRSVFAQLPDAVGGLRTDEIEFCYGRRPIGAVAGHIELSATTRVALDAWLRDLALAAGAVPVTGRAVTGADPETGRVTLAGGEVIEADLVLGCDGVNSAVARALDGAAFDRETIGFGLEIEVPAADLPPAPCRAIRLDLGAANWGYGWRFPKTHGATLGVAGLHACNPDMKARLAELVAANGLDPVRYPPKGHFIPFGDYRKKPGMGRVLLCGDAAGYVDPITGEGIAYAIQSGHAAALAVINALKAGRPGRALPAYRRATAPIRRDLWQARLWRRMLFPPRRAHLLKHSFAGATGLQKGFLDILDGRRGYGALPGLFVLQLAASLPRRLRHRFGRR